MKNINLTCAIALMWLFAACSEDTATPTSAKQPSSYCSLNGVTYQSDYASRTSCVAPAPTYYCSLNGVTYQSESAYKTGCVSPTYYCSLNGVTYTDLNQYNAYCVEQYCCERTGQCYNSKAVYDIQCSTPPSNGGGNNNGTSCTTCDCNPIFQDTYKAMQHTASCNSIGQQACKANVAKTVGCKL